MILALRYCEGRFLKIRGSWLLMHPCGMQELGREVRLRLALLRGRKEERAYRPHIFAVGTRSAFRF
jgi:hypothetical protein